MGSRYSDKTVRTIGRQLRYVHIDHLLQTKRVNCEEAFEEVVPEESSVSVSGSSSPPTVSVPSTPSKVSGSSTLPLLSVAVSKTTQDQPAWKKDILSHASRNCTPRFCCDQISLFD